jgi:hypothetical protein
MTPNRYYNIHKGCVKLKIIQRIFLISLTVNPAKVLGIFAAYLDTILGSCKLLDFYTKKSYQQIKSKTKILNFTFDSH